MKFRFWFFCFAIVGTFGGCGSTSGNPTLTFEFAPWVSANPLQAFNYIRTLVQEPAEVRDLYFCFKRLRLKKETDLVESEFDFQIGLKQISPAGVELGSISIPEQSFDRIEFDLDDLCDNGAAVSFVNRHGRFSTKERVQIRFRNQYEVVTSTTIKLEIQVLIDALQRVRSNDEIKKLLEEATGS